MSHGEHHGEHHGGHNGVHHGGHHGDHHEMHHSGIHHSATAPVGGAGDQSKVSWSDYHFIHVISIVSPWIWPSFTWHLW